MSVCNSGLATYGASYRNSFIDSIGLSLRDACESFCVMPIEDNMCRYH